MTTMRVPAKRLRDIQRVAHLAGALVLVAYIYSPAGSSPTFTTLMQFVIVPALTVTGLVMWQWPRLRRLLKLRSSTPATPLPGGRRAGGRSA